MADDAGALDALLGVLGDSIDRASAAALLDASGGSVEAAVAAHFARAAGEGPSAAAAAGPPPSPRAALRAVAGEGASDAQLAALLAEAGGSVEAAADRFFSSGAPDASAEAPAAEPPGGPSPPAGRRPRQAAVRAREAIGEELARIEAAATQAQQQQQQRQGQRQRQRQRRQQQPGAVAVPTQPRSGGRRGRGQPRPEATADDAPSESSTDGSSTGSEAVSDEGSEEAPDSADEDGSEGEQQLQLHAAGPSGGPGAAAARGREEDVWEPSAEMLEEYEAAQAAGAVGGGGTRRRQQRRRRRTAQAAQHYFQAVARMQDMVMNLDSSDSEGEAGRRRRGGGGAAEQATSGAGQLPGPDTSDWLLTGPAPGTGAAAAQRPLLCAPLLRAAAAAQAPAGKLRRPLPYQRWRTREGQLFARGCDFPAEELVPGDALKWPLLLGTFRFGLGQAKGSLPEALRSGGRHRLEFRLACEGQAPRLLRWPHKEHWRTLSSCTQLDVCAPEAGGKPPAGAAAVLCSLGGAGSPLAELCAALALLKSHGWAKLKSRLEVSAAGTGAGEAGGTGPIRVWLELGVQLTRRALTLEGPLAKAALQYETGGRCSYALSGSGAPPACTREAAEALRVAVHHLLAHGSGLSLGPDCDGLLNLQDADAAGLEALTAAPPESGAAEQPTGGGPAPASERRAAAKTGAAAQPAEATSLPAAAAAPAAAPGEAPAAAEQTAAADLGRPPSVDPPARSPEAGGRGKRKRRPTARLLADESAAEEAGEEAAAQLPAAPPAPEPGRKRQRAAAAPKQEPPAAGRLTRNAASALAAQAAGASGSGPAAGAAELLPGLGGEAEAAAEKLQRAGGDSDVSRIMRAGQLPPDFPAADQPPQLLTAAKGWQLQGLAWMLEREVSGDPLQRGSLRLHPAWLQLRSQDGQLLYCHRLAPHHTSPSFHAAPAGGTCGGFLADAMGLGKTLQVIMLALQHTAPADWAVRSYEEAKGVRWEVGRKPSLSLRTTLVVVPHSLRLQWLDELRKHVRPGALAWCAYSTQASVEASEAAEAAERPDALARLWGAADDGRLVPLCECDIAVVTYEALMDELRRVKRPPLLQWGYWRLVLDEAQLVSRTNTQAAAAVSDIYRRHAWVVTGTPVTSRLDEIQGLLAFLDLDPYYHAKPWAGLLDSGSNGGGAGSLLPLAALLRTVMLRRRKEDVGADLALPPCSHEDWWLDLSRVERAVYEGKRREAEAALQLWVQARASADAQLRKHVNRCKRLLTDLRQACCDPQMVRAKEEAATSGRRSMQAIMHGLVMKAFHAYDAGLRGALQAQMLAAAFRPDAEAQTAGVLREMQRALVASGGTDVGALLAGRREDGGLAPAPAGEDAGAAALAALQALRPELDDFGERVAWHVTWRRRKRRECEAAGLAPPLPEEPDPRHRWQEEDQEAAAAAEQQPPAPAPAPAAKAAEPAAPPAEAAGGRQAKRRRTSAAAQLAAAPKEEPRSSEKLAKRAAERERAARREAAKRRAAERQQELEAWLQRQAPAPASEADEAAEEAARAAAGRLRSWAKGLLDAAECRADVLQSLPEGEGGASSSCGGDLAVETVEARELAGRLRDLLGEDREGAGAAAAAAAAGEEPRFSRRKREMQPGQQMQAPAYEALLQQHAAKERANNPMLAELDKLRAKKQPERLARKAHAQLQQALAELWRAARRQAALQAEVAAKEKGKRPAAAAAAAAAAESAGGVASVEQEDIYTCPICTDLAEARTVTACGHFFCSACLARALALQPACPLCRRPLAKADLHDAFTAEEAAAAAAPRAELAPGEFSTKVNAVVREALRMRQAGTGSKAVVFSAWSRLLRVTGLALGRARVPHVSLAAAPQEQRALALRTFQTDPDCCVLLVVLSTLGGAAGLTLTAADTVILMEPSLWPGLEEQAAGRIHRLGQTRPTRVVRLLARGTVEAAVLQEQRRRLAGGRAAEETMADVDAGTVVALLEAHPAAAAAAGAVAEAT